MQEERVSGEARLEPADMLYTGSQFFVIGAWSFFFQLMSVWLQMLPKLCTSRLEYCV